jgi:hypothetical protein
MHTSSRRILLALLMGLIVATPAAAHAQLGGFIKKKVGDKVADKVAGRVLGEEQGSSRAPKFSANVLEINADRIGQVLRGLDAEGSARDAAMAPFRSYETARAAYERAISEMTTCHQRASAAYDASAGSATMALATSSSAAMTPAMMEFTQRMAALPEKDRDALEARMAKAAEDMAAANDRGDTQTAMRIGNAAKADMEKTVGVPMPAAAAPSASSQANAAKVMGAQEKLQSDMARCGTTAPTAPVEPPGYSNANAAVRDSVRAAAVRASGLEPAQYAILRERMSAWLAIQNGKSAGSYVFASGEIEALEARERDLRARESALLGETQAGGWQF